ncbi:WYL domain-containing protein [Corynebacterium sp.]|uniref:helix-turn-helix transcriptional regulator n=1 Tax=Corynebacterium sp. TaxID=1720 RepID=UPI002A90E9B7|nr:WYL domain-containing protein [Corynebacterium sp.]MDY5785476.1 WYL domain-containing protein [Corynebacterium sp.]
MKDSPVKLEGLVRSLNLIPYLRQHPGATPMEIARDLGYSHDDVMADLTRLSMSGVGNGPGELIDLVASWTGITVIDDQGLNKPLRLTPTEANALLLTLESLETMPGLINHDAVTSAAAKLRRVAHGRGVEDADHPAGDNASVAAVIAEALAKHSMLEVEYYSASSDTTSTRTVAPVSLFHTGGETYLRAVEGQQEKSFRLDRIRAASRSYAGTHVSLQTLSRNIDAADPFGFADATKATLLIRDTATWLADYWEIELDDVAGADGWHDARMAYGSPEWLIRFCLSQADRVRLVEPAELAREVGRRAAAAVEGLR